MARKRTGRSPEDDRTLLLWEAPAVEGGEEAGGRTGLACYLTFCQRTGCTCDSVWLDAWEIDERFERFDVEEERVAPAFRRPPGDARPLPRGYLPAEVTVSTG